jgi:hypothetical protein
MPLRTVKTGRTQAGRLCDWHKDLPFNVDRITETEYMIERVIAPLMLANAI